MRACDVNATRGCLDNRNSHQINKSMQIEYVCVQKLFYGVYNGPRCYHKTTLKCVQQCTLVYLLCFAAVVISLYKKQRVGDLYTLSWYM